MSDNGNILLDPIPELTKALETNTWGITSSEIIVADCFPTTAEDIDAVRKETSEKGSSGRVVGKARTALLEGDEIVVLLDQRGFTIDSSSKPFPAETYETLESLLIAISPLYVEAMAREISARFEGFSSRTDHPEEDDAGQPEVWL